MNLSSQLRRSSSFARLLSALALLVVALAGYTPRALAAPPETTLEFNGSGVGIAPTGFTTVLQGTNEVGGNLLSGGGALKITSTGGDLVPGAPATQDNALSVAPYTSSGSYTIGARLLGPLPFNGKFQSGGIYIGQDQSSFIRLTAGIGSKRSDAERIQLDVMDRGKLRSSTILLAPGTLAGVTKYLDLFLTIQHGGPGKITALYRIDSDDPNAGQLATTRNFPRWLRGNANQVYAGLVTTSRDALPIELSFDWFHLTQAPQVAATITGSKTVDKDGLGQPVNPGDTLTYTISVSNSGNAGATLQVADPIPADTTYISGTLTTNPTVGTTSFDSANNRVLWQQVSLAKGTSASISFQVTVNQLPLQSSVIENDATLTNVSAGGLQSVLSTSTLVNGIPDLTDSIYTATPATVGPGQTIAYSLTLLNNGTATANHATAQLMIPSGTTYVPNSATQTPPSGSLSVNTAISQINWTAGSPLQVGDAVTIAFQAQAGALPNGTVLASDATLQADGTVPNVETAQAIVTVVTDVTGKKTVNKAVANPGETLTYMINVSNKGNAPASLKVEDPTPVDTAFVFGSLTTSAGVPAATFDGAKVIWQAPPQAPLASSQSVTITFQVKINALPLHSAKILNQATLTNDSQGGLETVLPATTLLNGVPDLNDSTYIAAPATVGQNGLVTYSLDLRNSGTAAATNATAQLSIPAGMSYMIGSATASSGSLSINTSINQINWTADNNSPLPVGAVVRISFQARVGSGLPNGAVLASQASMRSSETLEITKTANAVFSQSAPLTKILIYLPLVQR